MGGVVVIDPDTYDRGDVIAGMAGQLSLALYSNLISDIFQMLFISNHTAGYNPTNMIHSGKILIPLWANNLSNK